MMLGRSLFLTALVYASAPVPSRPYSMTEEHEHASDQYFPHSDLVLEMAQLSHSV